MMAGQIDVKPFRVREDTKVKLDGPRCRRQISRAECACRAENFDMERVVSQVRSMSSGIRRRLAVIVEAAAAGLASAGA